MRPTPTDRPSLDLALEIYHHQYEHLAVYRDFVDRLSMANHDYSRIDDIPHLPISAFKHHDLQTGDWQPEVVYTSSGTGGQPSRHRVRSEYTYLEGAQRAFEAVYGSLQDYVFIALLPSYLEREGSSLITMLRHFIDASEGDLSGFHLHDLSAVLHSLRLARASGRPSVLWGVTYALLDLGEVYDLDWPDLIVLETGGMKGRRAEMLRDDLHDALTRCYGVDCIHSEYGMTECMSQAYSTGSGLFYPSSTMHVHARSLDDPLAVLPAGKTGALHIYDQANVDTCAFIATDDLGMMREDGAFTIQGRRQGTEARGCNLLIEEIT